MSLNIFFRLRYIFYQIHKINQPGDILIAGLALKIVSEVYRYPNFETLVIKSVMLI